MRSFSLLRYIGKAILRVVVGGFTGAWSAEYLIEMAEVIWGWWTQDNSEPPRQVIEALAQATGEEIRTQVEQIVQEMASDQPKVVQQQMSQYLTQVPAMVRRSLRRPSDPTGRTVPAGLVLHKAEDLLQFLPQQLPRFVPGDRPLPGVDWELAPNGFSGSDG
jgi:hypothetical protein